MRRPHAFRTSVLWVAGVATFVMATVAGFAVITTPAKTAPQALSTVRAAPLAQPNQIPTPAPVVAILGDSYTVGIGADLPEHGWAPQFAAALGAQLVNDGVSGTGYVWGASISPFGDRVAQVIAAHPAIVIVQGSVNDSIDPSNFAEIQGDATYVLQTLKTGLPNSRIVVVGPAATPKFTASVVVPDAASVKAAADAAGLPFLDTTGVLDPNDPSLWAPDGIHPDTAGHTKLAQAILAAYLALPVN